MLHATAFDLVVWIFVWDAAFSIATCGKYVFTVDDISYVSVTSIAEKLYLKSRSWCIRNGSYCLNLPCCDIEFLISYLCRLTM